MKRTFAVTLVLSFSMLALNSGAIAQGSGEAGAVANGSRAALPTPNMTLYRTKAIIANGSNSFGTTPVLVFPKTSIACPATPATCTLRIDVVSQFQSSVAGSLAMDILVDGAATGIAPASLVNVNSTVASTSTSGSMTFYKSVGPGSHAVQVRFVRTSGSGTASAGFKILTLSTYTP